MTLPLNIHINSINYIIQSPILPAVNEKFRPKILDSRHACQQDQVTFQKTDNTEKGVEVKTCGHGESAVLQKSTQIVKKLKVIHYFPDNNLVAKKTGSERRRGNIRKTHYGHQETMISKNLINPIGKNAKINNLGKEI